MEKMRILVSMHQIRTLLRLLTLLLFTACRKSSCMRMQSVPGHYIKWPGGEAMHEVAELMK